MGIDSSLNHLVQSRKSIEQLNKILVDCDPASGISFYVRRGVLLDNVDVEGDSERRPLVPVEFGDLKKAEDAVALMIRGLEESVRLTKRFLTERLEEARLVLEEN